MTTINVIKTCFDRGFIIHNKTVKFKCISLHGKTISQTGNLVTYKNYPGCYFVLHKSQFYNGYCVSEFVTGLQIYHVNHTVISGRRVVLKALKTLQEQTPDVAALKKILEKQKKINAQSVTKEIRADNIRFR